eukprot:8415713-Pyramimonas_sp.AAC.1
MLSNRVGWSSRGPNRSIESPLMGSTQDSPGSPRGTVYCGSPSTSSKSLRRDTAGWCGKGLGPRSTRM